MISDLLSLRFFSYVAILVFFGPICIVGIRKSKRSFFFALTMAAGLLLFLISKAVLETRSGSDGTALVIAFSSAFLQYAGEAIMILSGLSMFFLRRKK